MLNQLPLIARTSILIALCFTVGIPRAGAASLRFFDREIEISDLRKLSRLGGAADPTGEAHRLFPNLRILVIPNDETSSDADIRFYDRYLREKAAEGLFLAAGDTGGDPERPYLGEDLVAYRSAVPRYVIQHEILHYLIDLGERATGTGFVTFKHLANEIMARGPAQDPWQFLNVKLDVIRRTSLEEVAMVELMLRRRFELHMDVDQARAELLFGLTHLIRGSRQVSELYDLIIRQKAHDHPAARVTVHRIEDVSSEIGAVADFFNTTMCELYLR